MITSTILTHVRPQYVVFQESVGPRSGSTGREAHPMKVSLDPWAKIALFCLASANALGLLAAFLLALAAGSAAAEDWLQLKFDSRHSGNAADRKILTTLGLIAAAPLTDAIFTAPVVRAYDLETGKEVWTRDLSANGCGGDDAGICLLDGRLYYSCFFGASARLRSGLPGPQGITAAIAPQTGKIRGTLAHGYKCTRLSLSGSCLLGPAMDVYELSGNAGARLLSTGPRMDPSECIGACVSNGRIFYTGHGAGLQASQLYGAEAASATAKPIGRPATK